MSKEISDRTNRFANLFFESEEIDVSETFGKISIAITANEEQLCTQNGQVMIVTLVNLIARFHPNINLLIPDAIQREVWIPFGRKDSLTDSLVSMVTQVGSKTSIGLDKAADVVISVGETEASAKYKITIGSDGWFAYLSSSAAKSFKPSSNQNPIGAQTAACFGAAEVFRKILELLGSRDRRITRNPGSFEFSTLDYSLDNSKAPNPPISPSVDVGEIVIVGAGAVANGLVNALAMTPQTKGIMELVDYGFYDSTNLNRCLTASLQQVGSPKACAIASTNLSNFKVVPQVGKYHDIRKASSKLGLVVSTVDNTDARIQIQSDLPRTLFHGATGENACTISKHNFINGACLGCIFFREDEIPAVSIAMDTGLPTEEVEKLLSGHATLSKEHLSIISSRTGVALEKLEPFLGGSILQVYQKEICGVMRVPIEQGQFAATASFVSALPGILLAGEIIKEKAPELGQFSLNNYLSLSLFNPSARWLLTRQKHEKCRNMCSNPIMIEAYLRKWSAWAS